MKLEHILLFFTLWIGPQVFGQFSDDFSDGNLDGWEGDVSNFIVNASNQLQLNAPSGSTLSWVHTPVTFSDSMIWQLYLKLDFAPSTTNQLRIYLGVNGTDLTTASGYFLEIGASGDIDPLELKYLHNGTAESVAQSADGLVALQPVELTLRVVKKNNGQWECYKLGGAIPELLFSATHDVLPLSQLTNFGFYCKYSDTRRDKFYFDNINIQEPQPDITAPSLVSLGVQDAYSVQLTFDEPIENTSATPVTHYVLTPSNSNPNTIDLNANQITLHWTNPFVSLQPYTLAISGLKDAAGNVMVPTNQNFTYVDVAYATSNELLITEIMADPTPVIGLPDAEYLEVFNNSNKVFRLSDYTLTVSSSVRNLPDELIYPGEYIVLCDPDFVSSLSPFGRTIGVDNMPTLTNSGSYLALKDFVGFIIHDLTYSTTWYKNPDKVNGGWSLEMINPFNSCSGESNWAAANNLLGGTPGTQNSSWQTTPDTEGPTLISVYASTPQTIELRFNEKLEATLMENPAAYTIQPTLGIADAMLIDPAIVQLTLSAAMQPGVVYQLYPFNAYDCLGNKKIHADTIKFGLIVDAQPGDVFINEILFNPLSGGSRFLEIINGSEKFINLNSLVIARLTSANQDLYATGLEEVLGPGEIAAFTPNPQDILSRYVVPLPNKLYKSSLPSWDDKSDNVSILVNGMVIDSLTYSSDWHHPVIADQNGVSLERVSMDVGSTISDNWHSASSLSGYATPTGENSQTLNSNPNVESPYTITNRNFSPNDDGYKDYLALQFDAGAGDEIASVWIYDREGREVQQLLSNELIGTSGLVTWDGRNKDGGVSEMGIYILFVRLWKTNGDVKEYQETCALIKR
jgi:hypothetical protein